MTLFDLIRREVAAEDAAKVYGLPFGRNGRARCPWHEDHNPDLKFYPDGTCYCFACHAGGDATALTAQIFGMGQLEAAERLREDFHLDQPIDDRPMPTAARQRRDQREQQRGKWIFLCDVVHEADALLTTFPAETAWNNPVFRAVLMARARADEQLDMMWWGLA